MNIFTEKSLCSRQTKAFNEIRIVQMKRKFGQRQITDSQGRPFEVVTADGAKVTTSFGLSTSGTHIGTTVTVTDQANKQRRSITNALGQMTRVDEPNDAGNLGTLNAPTQQTLYAYDTLNNLITGQSRRSNSKFCV